MLALFDATACTPGGILHQATLLVDDSSRISYVGPITRFEQRHGRSVDLQGMLLSPGFIDIHTHGGRGITFGQPGRQADDLAQYSQWVLRSGVTGFICSLAAPDRASLLSIVAECAEVLEIGLPGAEGLGIHLEGPFLNPERRGAFSRSWLRQPTLEEATALLEAGRGWIRMVTLAPELPRAGEVAALFHSAGVTVALGHSDASYEVASDALQGRWTHVTHTCNAQSPFTHRQPGVVGAVLTSERVTAELIADGVHLHAGALKLLNRCLGTERLVLVTDAMAAAGLGNGEYRLVGELVTVVDGVARLSDGTLAGSTATMDSCLRHWISATGCSPEVSTRLASTNAARAVGAMSSVGKLVPGKLANLTVLDQDLRVRLVVVRGKIVYEAGLA